MKGREAFAAATNVSRETLERFETYAALIKKWNPAINLVARSTLAELWSRHFLDSAQVLGHAPETAKTWADLGTGGGFPGLVVAILAAELRPQLAVTCIESDVRKATFLRSVLRETGVPGTVISKRIEEVAPLEADVVSARALAPLPELLTLAGLHLAPGGTALFLKGATHAREVEAALASWAFSLDTYPSSTDPDATILKLGDLRRV